MSFFKPPADFSLNIASSFRVMTHNSSVNFSPNIIYFGQKDTIKVQTLRLSSVGSKFAKFFMSFFKAQVRSCSSFLSFFSVMTHNSSEDFWLKQYTFDKSSTSKCKFSDLPLLALKFTKFIMLFLEQIVSFSSNFESLFSAMGHNSSVLFHRRIYMIWTKRNPFSCKILDFQLLTRNFTKFVLW